MKKAQRLIIIILFSFVLYGCSNLEDNATIERIDEEAQEHEQKENDITYDERETLFASNKRQVLTQIRIRDIPSTEGNIVGHVDEEDIVEVLDIQNDGKYTWYRIGDNQWIADDGTWTSKVRLIKFKSNNGTGESYLQENSEGRDFIYAHYDYTLLENNRFSYLDHIFVGWNTEPDGSGRHVFENDYAIDALGDSDTVCLYAQWEPIVETNISIKVTDEIELNTGPNIKKHFIKGYIREDDYLEIYEQVYFQDKIWNRVSDNLWFTDNEDNYERIESVPEIEIVIGSFDYPKKIVSNSDNKIETLVFNYEGGNLSSVSRSGFYVDGESISYEYQGMIPAAPSYCYGSGVETVYNENGQIIEQISKPSITTYHFSYEYNSAGNIMHIYTWYETFGDGFDYMYEYDESGKLILAYHDNPELRFGYKYEYNGNIVFVDNYTKEKKGNKEERTSFCEMYRYDTKGRVIQSYYPQSVQAPWNISDYYY